MNPQTAFGIISLVVALLSVDYFTRHPIDMGAIRGRLSDIKTWLYTGDRDVVYPVAIITGGSLVVIASWLRWVL